MRNIYTKGLTILMCVSLLSGAVPTSIFAQDLKKYTLTPSKNQYDVSLVSETTRHVPSERALAIKNLEFKDAVTRMSNLKNINVTPGKLEASETSEAYRYFTSVGKSKRSSSAAHGKIISEYYHILRDYEYLKADATGREVWTAPGRGHKDMYITVKNADGSVKMAVTFNALNKGFLKAFAKSFEKVTDRETALHYSEQVYKIMLKTDGVDYDTNHVLAAYFKKGLELKWVCDEISGMEIREDWAIARNKKDRLCPNAVTSMLALGYLGQGEQNVYEFLNHNYMGRNAHAVLKGGANALMLMDSEASYEALKKVIKNSVKKATPTNVFKIALNAFFDLIWVTSYVERGYKYFKGVYNNEVTIRFEYPDVKHIKKFGLPSTAGKCTPFSSTRDCVMMPTRNVWEDIGSELILFGGARGKKLVSELVSEEPNLHKPFTIGAAIYSDYNQKLYYAYKAGSAYADMPEGTRRRIELELGRGSAINENHIGMVTEYRKAMSGARGFDQIMGGVYMVALVVSLPSFMEFVASIPQWARGSRLGKYFKKPTAVTHTDPGLHGIGGNFSANVNKHIGRNLIKDANAQYTHTTPNKMSGNNTPILNNGNNKLIPQTPKTTPISNSARPQVGAAGEVEVLTQSKPKTQPKPTEAQVQANANLFESLMQGYTKTEELLQVANKGKGSSIIGNLTGTGSTAIPTQLPAQTPNLTKGFAYVTTLAGTIFNNKQERYQDDYARLEIELNNARNGLVSEFLLANFYRLSQEQQKELNKILDEVSKRPSLSESIQEGPASLNDLYKNAIKDFKLKIEQANNLTDTTVRADIYEEILAEFMQFRALVQNEDYANVAELTSILFDIFSKRQETSAIIEEENAEIVLTSAPQVKAQPAAAPALTPAGPASGHPSDAYVEEINQLNNQLLKLENMSDTPEKLGIYNTLYRKMLALDNRATFGPHANQIGTTFTSRITLFRTWLHNRQQRLQLALSGNLTEDFELAQIREFSPIHTPSTAQSQTAASNTQTILTPGERPQRPAFSAEALDKKYRAANNRIEQVEKYLDENGKWPFWKEALYIGVNKVLNGNVISHPEHIAWLNTLKNYYDTKQLQSVLAEYTQRVDQYEAYARENGVLADSRSEISQSILTVKKSPFVTPEMLGRIADIEEEFNVKYKPAALTVKEVEQHIGQHGAWMPKENPLYQRAAKILRGENISSKTQLERLKYLKETYPSLIETTEGLIARKTPAQALSEIEAYAAQNYDALPPFDSYLYRQYSNMLFGDKKTTPQEFARLKNIQENAKYAPSSKSIAEITEYIKVNRMRPQAGSPIYQIAMRILNEKMYVKPELLTDFRQLWASTPNYRKAVAGTNTDAAAEHIKKLIEFEALNKDIPSIYIEAQRTLYYGMHNILTDVINSTPEQKNIVKTLREKYGLKNRREDIKDADKLSTYQSIYENALKSESKTKILNSLLEDVSVFIEENGTVVTTKELNRAKTLLKNIISELNGGAKPVKYSSQPLLRKDAGSDVISIRLDDFNKVKETVTSKIKNMLGIKTNGSANGAAQASNAAPKAAPTSILKEEKTFAPLNTTVPQEAQPASKKLSKLEAEEKNSVYYPLYQKALENKTFTPWWGALDTPVFREYLVETLDLEEGFHSFMSFGRYAKNVMMRRLEAGYLDGFNKAIKDLKTQKVQLLRPVDGSFENNSINKLKQQQLKHVEKVDAKMFFIEKPNVKFVFAPRVTSYDALPGRKNDWVPTLTYKVDQGNMSFKRFNIFAGSYLRSYLHKPNAKVIYIETENELAVEYAENNEIRRVSFLMGKHELESKNLHFHMIERVYNRNARSAIAGDFKYNLANNKNPGEPFYITVGEEKIFYYEMDQTAAERILEEMYRDLQYHLKQKQAPKKAIKKNNASGK
ncbi:hypothetical protein AAIR98_001180 [Elusimicrobium simillimum]|uniref:hypothetical protein n=1 Tax=Elusimicrobium simillimum TaxID=3143438 RepID=UPI003C6FFEF8